MTRIGVFGRESDVEDMVIDTHGKVCNNPYYSQIQEISEANQSG